MIDQLGTTSREDDDLDQAEWSTSAIRKESKDFASSPVADDVPTISQEGRSPRVPSDPVHDKPPTHSEVMVGNVAGAQWPKALIQDGDEDVSAGADWLLIKLNKSIGFDGAVRCNRFYVPDTRIPQMVAGFYETQDLTSGSVWICGGVSGVQEGYLNKTPASVILAGVSFNTLSISLKRPLRRSAPIRVA